MLMSNEKTSQVRRTAMILLAAVLFLALGAFAMLQPADAATCVKYHTIASGDTLYKIAATYNVDWQAIVAANDLKPPYTLIIGTSLCIPEAAATTGTPAAAGTPSAKTSKEPTMKLEGYSNYLEISVSNFPTNVVFYIKGGEGWVNPEGIGGVWYRIGRLKTDKNGAGSAAYRLPTRLHLERPIIICLKNTLNDDAYCKYYLSETYWEHTKISNKVP